MGSPKQELPAFMAKNEISHLVTDFDPLRIKTEWKKEVAAQAKTYIHEVDARNIVPCWAATDKKEYAAYTLRPKIHRALPEFMEKFPLLQNHPFPWPESVKQTNWDKAEKSLKIDRSVPEVDWLLPGEKAAADILDQFLTTKLSTYSSKRNDPNEYAVSHLSPYLHFGQISAQRVALEVRKRKVSKASKMTSWKSSLSAVSFQITFATTIRTMTSLPDFRNGLRKRLTNIAMISGSTSIPSSSLRAVKPTMTSGTLPNPRWLKPGRCTAT
jgi:deoxyribodipyrimidine photo-lyase